MILSASQATVKIIYSLWEESAGHLSPDLEHMRAVEEFRIQLLRSLLVLPAGCEHYQVKWEMNNARRYLRRVFVVLRPILPVSQTLGTPHKVPRNSGWCFA